MFFMKELSSCAAKGPLFAHGATYPRRLENRFQDLELTTYNLGGRYGLSSF